MWDARCIGGSTVFILCGVDPFILEEYQETMTQVSGHPKAGPPFVTHGGRACTAAFVSL